MDARSGTRSLIVPLSRSYLCDTKPPVAKEFNNPETSDLRIRVGDKVYNVHKLILSSASPVFKRMLSGSWKESSQGEIRLNDDCEELVEKFLQFLYSGHIIMLSSNIVKYYTLADKYNVKSLASVCLRHILDGLAVTSSVFDDIEKVPVSLHCPHVDAPELPSAIVSKSSDHLDVSDWFAHLPLTHCYSCRLSVLSPCMHFSLSTVIELINFPNKQIAEAAYFSFIVSLLKIHESTLSWASASNMPYPLLLTIIQDNNFYALEDHNFDLVFEWLQANITSTPTNVVLELLSCIRWPLMSRENLYRSQSLLRRTNWITESVMESLEKRLRTAERYQLYAALPDAASQEDWNGSQFTYRNACDVFEAVVDRASSKYSIEDDVY